MWSSPSQAPSTLQMLLTQVARCLPAGGKTHAAPLQTQQNKGEDEVRVEHRRVTSAQVGRAGPPRVEVFLCPPSLPSLQPSPPPLSPSPCPAPSSPVQPEVANISTFEAEGSCFTFGTSLSFSLAAANATDGCSYFFFLSVFFSFHFFPS